MVRVSTLCLSVSLPNSVQLWYRLLKTKLLTLQFHFFLKSSIWWPFHNPGLVPHDNRQQREGLLYSTLLKRKKTFKKPIPWDNIFPGWQRKIPLVEVTWQSVWWFLYLSFYLIFKKHAAWRGEAEYPVTTQPQIHKSCLSENSKPQGNDLSMFCQTIIFIWHTDNTSGEDIPCSFGLLTCSYL